MNIKILVSLVLLGGISGIGFAVSSAEVEQNLTNYVRKINQVNHDLTQKHNQKKDLDGAIDDSNAAIEQFGKLLGQLQQERKVSATQLDDITRAMPQIRLATQSVQDNVKIAITRIYQQIKILQNNTGSILSVNDTLQTQRKTQYLINLLKIEQLKYQNLQSKLDELNLANDKLAAEVMRIDKELDAKTREWNKLQTEKAQQIEQAQILNQQIKNEQQQLLGLTQKQAELNRLLIVLAATKTTGTNGTEISRVKPDVGSKSSLSFFNRTLAKPVNAKVLVSYGDTRNSGRNNGVLYSGANSIPVYSVSSGKVMYSGDLPGFGQVIVIDHGDNYMSIYGGVLPHGILRGQNVNMGQTIADSGSVENQPMGGVYFELRHYGKPVNPANLMN